MPARTTKALIIKCFREKNAVCEKHKRIGDKPDIPLFVYNKWV
jgi:hypothetical protein